MVHRMLHARPRQAHAYGGLIAAYVPTGLLPTRAPLSFLKVPSISLAGLRLEVLEAGTIAHLNSRQPNILPLGLSRLYR